LHCQNGIAASKKHKAAYAPARRASQSTSGENDPIPDTSISTIAELQFIHMAPQIAPIRTAGKYSTVFRNSSGLHPGVRILKKHQSKEKQHKKRNNGYSPRPRPRWKTAGKACFINVNRQCAVIPPATNR